MICSTMFTQKRLKLGDLACAGHGDMVTWGHAEQLFAQPGCGVLTTGGGHPVCGPRSGLKQQGKTFEVY